MAAAEEQFRGLSTCILRNKSADEVIGSR